MSDSIAAKSLFYKERPAVLSYIQRVSKFEEAWHVEWFVSSPR